VDVELVTANYFRVLGVQPALGRFFMPDEDRAPVGSLVAVVSHGFWRHQLGEARDVVGHTIVLDGKTFTIVGVAPEHFTGVDLENVDLWVPVSALAATSFGDDWATSPHSIWVRTVGRLAPGATPARVNAEATVAFRRAVRSWEQPRRDTLATIVAGPIVAARGPEQAPAEARISLWLVGVAGIVLLVACANVATLLLARAAGRRREIAVRLALGVGRRRLVRQLLTETLLLATLAAVAALLVTHWGGAAVRTLLLPNVAWEGSPLDARVLAFTTAATMLTVLLAGLAPALQASATDVAGALAAGTRQGGARRSALHAGLLVAQAALSVVLLVGAGLFVRSLHRVRAHDAGIDLPRVLLVRIDLERAGFATPRVRALYTAAVERARQIPGVERAALAAMSVPTQTGAALSTAIPGRDSLPPLPNGGPYYGAVGADYFAALGARVVRGRGITDADERLGARVAVVNETLARHYWPPGSGSPLGTCVLLGSDSTCTEVVGVVQDIMLFRLVNDERAQLYLPLTHPAFPVSAPGALLVRTGGEAAPVAGPLRRQLQGLAPGMPYVDVRSFEELVAPQLQPWRLGATMFAVFGGLALLIAAVGLYGVLAYAVSQRTHEVGVRMALGATTRDVVGLVVRDGVRVAGLGLALGAGIALAAGRFVAPLLYETSPRDPVVLGTTAVVLLVVAVLASLIPARRAAHVDPSVALRGEP
jgi:predicted permease